MAERTLVMTAALLLAMVAGAVPAPAAAQDTTTATTQDTTTAAAQDTTAAAAQETPQRATIVDVNEPRLVFEREVFAYQRENRRDPFQPLTGLESGPLFDELRLQGIIYSDAPADSRALVVDAAGRRYRLRRGDTVGPATVIDIQPTRVIFSVSDFGQIRPEVLDLLPIRGGA